ncbi:MAG: hypothetical protein K2P41_15910 [Lachnospiraceae bacterium]|nr:hypothetical protein [Lachnospiraceae bacterium]
MNLYDPNFFNWFDALTGGQLSFYLSNPNLPAPLPDDAEQRSAVLKMRKAIDDFHSEQKKILPEYQQCATKNILAEIARQIQKDRQANGQ